MFLTDFFEETVILQNSCRGCLITEPSTCSSFPTTMGLWGPGNVISLRCAESMVSCWSGQMTLENRWQSHRAPSSMNPKLLQDQSSSSVFRHAHFCFLESDLSILYTTLPLHLLIAEQQKMLWQMKLPQQSILNGQGHWLHTPFMALLTRMSWMLFPSDLAPSHSEGERVSDNRSDFYVDEVWRKMCQKFIVSYNFQTTLPQTSQYHFTDEIDTEIQWLS